MKMFIKKQLIYIRVVMN